MPAALKLKAPAANSVYQRDANGRSEIPINLPDSHQDGKIVAIQINNGALILPGKLVDSKLVGVPTGGPYAISCQIQQGANVVNAEVHDVFVGDLWVLAGQSNMEGVGNLLDVTPPHPRVSVLGMNGKWSPAEEPLHWLVDSPDPVHSGDPKTRAERAARTHKTRTKGAGLGLPFAAALVESTGVPIGLVACAHGGTSMEQWNPSKKGQGGNSLYGSMLRHVRLAGGKVKGVLWYQGESDASPAASKVYAKVFKDFIAAVRADFGQPELPFYLVQIGRFVNAGDPKGWNTVQEAQRVLPERVPNTALVSVIDLELDDLIHVGTQGMKRAGQRLARIAERELFGQIGATTPTLDRVTDGPNNTLVVKFKGVNISAASPGERGGIAGGRGGPRGMGGMGAGGMGRMGPQANGAGGGMRSVAANSDDTSGFGLRPERHIAGFSIRKPDGADIPLIYEACVGKAGDTVILKLTRRVPEQASLWYGYGMDPYCNLTDGLDMAVPVFGPIALDDVVAPRTNVAAGGSGSTPRQAETKPVKLLIITGDNVGAHAWKDTTAVLKEFLSEGGRISVDVTSTPSTDLTDDNLSKYDVLLLNYKDTANGTPETRWSEANKQAFLKAVKGGKGLVVYHFASSAFTKPNWEEFEKAVAGGWRSQGFHGPKHVFTVKKTDTKHPISDGLPAEFEHTIDELYQNSVMVPESTVLATAFSDGKKPQGTDKDEPVIWVNKYGEGRVYENVLGHDKEAMADPNFRTWMRRGVIWAATGKVD
jgi:sialate O-acetylesterase